MLPLGALIGSKGPTGSGVNGGLAKTYERHLMDSSVYAPNVYLLPNQSRGTFKSLYDVVVI